MVTAIKAVHTLVWAIVEASVVYLLWTGLTGRSGRSVNVAAALVVGETVVFAANGFRCPLTTLAEAAGAEEGSVTDIFLPAWFAHLLPAIHTPLGVLLVWLHRKSIRRGWGRIVVGV